jgi:uncharacterized protein (DUF427 family)
MKSDARDPSTRRPEESVWDYPRPPALEPCALRVSIRFGGEIIADTRRSVRVLETSHPPVYYIPPDDVRMEFLERCAGASFCEWKGAARYWSIVVGDRIAEAAAWSYPTPTERFESLADYLAFYPSRMEECRVDGEVVQAQEGDFYGGWITHEIRGPFKGGPGTAGW